MAKSIVVLALSLLLSVALLAGCEGPGGGGGGGVYYQPDTGGGDASFEVQTPAGDEGKSDDATATPDEGSQNDAPGPDDAGPLDDAAECSCEALGIECGIAPCGTDCGGCGAGEICEAGTCAAETVGDTVTPGECDETAFNGVDKRAESPQTGLIYYQEATAASWPADLLNIEIYQGGSFNGPTTSGTYDLTGSNYEDCGLCLRISTDCSVSGDSLDCDTEYYADEGSVEITEIGDRLTGVLHGVVFKEVTIDTTTYHSTPVAGGSTWCLDGHSFDQAIAGGPVDPSEYPVATDPAQAECVSAGNGTLIGANIADYTLKNCNGESVSLHESCGQDTATWLLGVTGWCTACTELLAQMSSSLGGTISPESVPSQWNLKLLLYEDQYGNAPSESYCKQYAVSHKVDPSMVLIDWTTAETQIPLVNPPGYAIGVNGLGNTWTKLNPYLVASGDTVDTFTPWHAVLRSKNMEYIWSSYFDQTMTVEGAIAKALSGQ